MNFKDFLKRLDRGVPPDREGAAVLPTTISETILALNPKAVAALAGSALAGAPILLTLENSQIRGISMRYILVHDELGPAGFVALSAVELDPRKPASGLSRKAARSRSAADSGKGSAAPGARPPLLRFLSGGHPLLHGSRFFNLRDGGPAPSVLASIARAIQRIRTMEDIPAGVLPDLAGKEVQRLEPLERYGYVRFPAAPARVIPIRSNWSSLGDFFDGLPGRDRRAALGHCRAFERTSLSIEEPRPTPIAAELSELYNESPVRDNGPPVEMSPAFFSAAEFHVREAFRLYAIRRNGQLIAFICALVDRNPPRGINRLVALFHAIRGRFSKMDHLFPALAHRLIEEAIEGQFEELDLGNLPAGSIGQAGFVERPLFYLIRSPEPTSGPIERLLFERVRGRRESPRRRAQPAAARGGKR